MPTKRRPSKPRRKSPARKPAKRATKRNAGHGPDLDALYASSHDYDTKRFNEWIERTTVGITKRTEYPKLGYIIHRYNEAGIPSILHGQSRDAPILRVPKEYEDRAWDILGEKMTPRAKKTLDDIRDDDPRFMAFYNVTPDTDLWER